MNKNAYEIRLEILQMAHDALMALFAEKCINLRVMQSKGYSVDVDQASFFPSTDQIKNRANELYKFVDSK